MSSPAASKIPADKRHKQASNPEKSSSYQSASIDFYGGMLVLQGSIGNQAVNQLIHSSLTKHPSVLGGEGNVPMGVGEQPLDSAKSTAYADDIPSFIHEAVKDLGEPLAPGIRSEFEVVLGQDLGQVRVHTSKFAASSARFIGAEAYTIGNHLVFSPGKFEPFTPLGRKLLAHELAHVVQMRGQAPRQLNLNGNLWESEAENVAHAHTARVASSVELSSAPSSVRPKLDPNLKSYLQELRTLAKEPGIADQPMETVANRIENALKGFNIQEEENYSIIADELIRLFPDRIVTEFLVRYASSPLNISGPSPEQRFMEQDEKRRKFRQPYKSGVGLHTPGTFFSSLLFDAFGSAVASIPVPPALTKAVSVGNLFVAGVYGGMSDSIEEEELRALVDKLNQAGLLAVAFPPIFLSGAAFGIAKDAVGFIKSTVGLFQGDLGVAVAAALEALQVLISSEGEKYSYQIGKELGRGFAQELRDALKQGLVHFTFSLGRIIGPTIVYLVLTLVGFPQAVLASAFGKVVPILRELLKNEARLLKVIGSLEQRFLGHPRHRKLPAPGSNAADAVTQPLGRTSAEGTASQTGTQSPPFEVSNANDPAVVVHPKKAVPAAKPVRLETPQPPEGIEPLVAPEGASLNPEVTASVGVEAGADPISIADPKFQTAEISATDTGPRRTRVPNAKPASPSPPEVKSPKKGNKQPGKKPSGKKPSGIQSSGNNPSGIQHERRVKRTDAKQRPPNSPDYHYFENGDFNDFVRSIEGHVTQMQPGAKVTLNKGVLTESRLAFIQRTKLRESAWMKRYMRLQDDLEAVNKTLSGIRGDKKTAQSLLRRRNAIERQVEERNKWLCGNVGTTKPDIVESLFGRGQYQVADITQRPFDPTHNFKTEFYVEVVKEITGNPNVIGLEFHTARRQKIVH